MTWIVIRSILFGLVGAVAAPVAVFFLVLVLAHAFDPRCGSPGDSGGCEMGALSLAVAMAVPGFALFFFITLIRALRRRNSDDS